MVVSRWVCWTAIVGVLCLAFSLVLPGVAETKSAAATSTLAATTPARLAPTEPGSFAALPPTRIVDTRYGTGTTKAAIPARGTRTFTVAGHGGVPTSGVGAASLKLTVTATYAAGYLSAYPGGSARPATSVLNFVGGRSAANLAIVRLGTAGTVTVYNGSDASVQVIADVSGYYLAGAPANAGMFAPITPARVLDTRVGTGAPKAQVPGNGALELPLAGVGGVPSADVGAVVMNVVATRSSAKGYVTVYPAGAERPASSVLNFSTSASVADLVVAQVGQGGAVTLYNGSSAPVDLVADVVGYFRAGKPDLAGGFGGAGPARVLDTRTGGHPVGAKQSVAVDPLSAPGAPKRGIAAVALTVTVTGAHNVGPITAYADGAPRPGTSETNAFPGRSVAAAVVVPVGSDGRVRLYNGAPGTLHLIVDVSGYFLAPIPHFEQVPRGPAFQAGDVSCASPSSCVAISNDRTVTPQYTVYGGQAWSTPANLPTRVKYVHCFAADNCLAVNTRQWTRFNGTAWSTPAELPHPVPTVESDDSFRFACAGPTFCLLYGYSDEDENFPPMRFDGTTWSDVAYPGVTLQTLSCGTSTCTGVGFNAGKQESTAFDGTTWSVPKPFPMRPTALSCSGSECVALGWGASGSTVYWTKLSGSGWSAPAVVAGFGSVRALSCASPTSCTAVGYLGSSPQVIMSDFDGTGWSAPVNRGMYGPLGFSKDEDAVSCPTSTACVAAVGDGALLVRNGTWPADPVFKGPVRDISCSASTWCVAVDGYGAKWTWNGAKWTYLPRTSAIDEFYAVSCGATDSCMAVGWVWGHSALYTHWNGASWSAAAALPGMPWVATVSCGSKTFCVALGYSGRPVAGTLADRFNGTSWTAITGSSTISSPSDISCTSSGYCLELGYALTGPGITAFNGTKWTTVYTKTNSADVPAISCAPASTTCLIAARGGQQDYVVRGTAAAAAIASPALGGGSINAVSCTSTQNCVGVGSDASGPAGWVTDFSSWSMPFAVANATVSPTKLSCVGAQFCVFA